MTVEAEGETLTSVTIENADELKTRKVTEGGQVYLGKDYGGKRVTVAFRVEDEQPETDDSETNEADTDA